LFAVALSLMAGLDAVLGLVLPDHQSSEKSS
jgi:hypothetical protein